MTSHTGWSNVITWGKVSHTRPIRFSRPSYGFPGQGLYRRSCSQAQSTVTMCLRRSSGGMPWHSCTPTARASIYVDEHDMAQAGAAAVQHATDNRVLTVSMGIPEGHPWSAVSAEHFALVLAHLHTRPGQQELLVNCFRQCFCGLLARRPPHHQSGSQDQTPSVQCPMRRP
jgi:hypothetical protein